MKKPLTFKQAGVIVVALHVAGFIGFTQYSSYKARVARELREEKKAEMLAGSRLKQDWNNGNIKPRIVATVTPKQNIENKPPVSNQIQQVLQKAELVARTATDSIKETATEVTALATTSMQTLNDKPQEIVKNNLPALQAKQPTKKQAVVSNERATKEAFLATKRPSPKPLVHSSPKIDINKVKENVQVIKSEVKRMTSEGVEYESYSVQKIPIVSGNTQVFAMGSDLLEAY